MAGKRQLYSLYAVLLLAIVMNISMWFQSRYTKSAWPNVPDPPSEVSITASFLGDKALAYRVWGLALQNFGNAGGDYRSFKDYDFKKVGHWFNRLDQLDPQSDFVPALAAYYFGATLDPNQVSYLIAYLEKVGVRPGAEKWRFLAHAVYLARHVKKDMDEARRLAEKLASIYRPGMPAWTLQMKALITADMGDKEAAYVLLKSMIATESDHMQPQEVNFMVDYICTKILTPEQVQHEPLCTPPKP